MPPGRSNEPGGILGFSTYKIPWHSGKNSAQCEGRDLEPLVNNEYLLTYSLSAEAAMSSWAYPGLSYSVLLEVIGQQYTCQKIGFQELDNFSLSSMAI